jgi:hypothetical protein
MKLIIDGGKVDFDGTAKELACVMVQIMRDDMDLGLAISCATLVWMGERGVSFEWLLSVAKHQDSPFSNLFEQK